MPSATKSKPVVTLRKDSDKTAEAVRYTMSVANGGIEFVMILGNIADVKADSIVFPTTRKLDWDGGGIRRSIGEKAGDGPFKEALGYLSTGGDGIPLCYAISTSAGEMKQVKNIIHSAILPDGLHDFGLVNDCVQNAIVVARLNGHSSIVFPEIGIAGLPEVVSLKANLAGISSYLETLKGEESSVKKVGYVMDIHATVENAASMCKMLRNAIEQ